MSEHEKIFFEMENPICSKPLLKLVNDGAKLRWAAPRECNRNISKKQLKQKRDSVVKSLYVNSSGNADVAKEILESIYENVLPADKKEYKNLDTEIVDGLCTSIKMLKKNGEENVHCTGGTRNKRDQQTLLAITGAVASGMIKNAKKFCSKVTTRLGITKRITKKAKMISSQVTDMDTPISDSIDNNVKRKTRSDCVRQYARQYVLEYCHSDLNSHRIDSNEKKLGLIY